MHCSHKTCSVLSEERLSIFLNWKNSPACSCCVTVATSPSLRLHVKPTAECNKLTPVLRLAVVERHSGKCVKCQTEIEVDE